MREQNFQQELKISIEALLDPVAYHKLPDPAGSYYPGAAKMRFGLKRPYDCYMLYKGIHHSFELKMKQSACGFALSSKKKLKDGTSVETGGDLRLHQQEALLEDSAAGGQSYILINYRFEKDGVKTNEVFVVDINKYIKHKRIILDSTNKKSLSYLYLQRRYPTIEKKKFGNRTYWDIPELLRIIEG